MDRKLAIVFFVIATGFLMAFYQNELLLTAIIGAGIIFVLSLDKWKRTKDFLVATLVGGLCENIAVFLGAWKYTNANYLFTPLWLPIGWGISVVLFEEAFTSKSIEVEFSKKSIFMAFGGTILAASTASNELVVLGAFIGITGILFLTGYYKRSEILVGLCAAIFGTMMETANILASNWQYNYAVFGTPIWLPLCWFNAFLIMRRIIRIGDRNTTTDSCHIYRKH